MDKSIEKELLCASKIENKLADFNLFEGNGTTLYICDMIIAFYSAVPWFVFITLAASIVASVPSLVSAPQGLYYVAISPAEAHTVPPYYVLIPSLPPCKSFTHVIHMCIRLK